MAVQIEIQDNESDEQILARIRKARFDAAAAHVEMINGLPSIVPIFSKTRKRGGHVYLGQDSGMKAHITKSSIRLVGTYCNKPVDITFKVGDTVEYDSYNLRYLGTIEKITDKRITVQPRYGAAKKSMDLYSFAWRNYNFDLQKALDENAETSMHI